MWFRFSTATVHKIDNTEIASDCKKHPIHHTGHTISSVLRPKIKNQKLKDINSHHSKDPNIVAAWSELYALP
ncbi:hypothetical protein ACN38_g11674 [Penicillium nordicum]|uniref:Uncharacterized protein n=1 Tax=Penicillium nordicum TaxID=229535 RepID=A0A0M8NUH6_9EURO|nr:hypothetical protein ACN38_g11674 [Penicillium nordicum]